MTRLHFSILISLAIAVTDPLYAQISLDSEPLPTLTFATSQPSTSRAGFNSGLTSSQRCASPSSRSLTHRPAFNNVWSVATAWIHCTPISLAMHQNSRRAPNFFNMRGTSLLVPMCAGAIEKSTLKHDRAIHEVTVGWYHVKLHPTGPWAQQSPELSDW